MLRSDTLFGKRENLMPNAPNNTASVPDPINASSLTKPTPPSIGGGSTGINSVNSKTLTAPMASTNPSTNSSTNEVGSKLIVGPNIKLKGVEITDCDTLVVEGNVEATIDSRVIQIAERGAFKGSAEIDIAEIHGEFDGDLIVRQKLVIYATGKVSGKVRYGKLVIEEGGQLAGDIQVGTSSNMNTRGLAVAKVAQ
jgi:cytoskeletal protein CcmA (bactofilin family)